MLRKRRKAGLVGVAGLWDFLVGKRCFDRYFTSEYCEFVIQASE